jgi:hypothetical protein
MKTATRTVIGVLAMIALHGEARAQSLDVPTVVFASGATTDWVTTYRNRNYFREGNPMIAWLDHRPAAMIGLGVGIDAAGVYGWQRLTRNRKRLRAFGLYAATAARVAVAIRNDRMRRHARDPRLRR